MIRRRLPYLALLAALILTGAGILQALAVAPANEHFQRTWDRTDRPVVEGQATRTWMWGPEAFTTQLSEVYDESPGGQRSVQYFDKARMEINDPGADPASLFFVTNGLLVVELISGRMQIGDNSFIDRQPATVNVAGDGNDPTGPTYASFGAVLNAAPLAIGSAITQRIDRAGSVTSDSSLVGQGVVVSVLDDVTNHAIAAPFWSFMNSTGTVYENGQFIQAQLFENPYFATGRPITEAYWAIVQVAGTPRLVLMQCFERRCLTYTPGNPPGFVVEAGNVGQHYYAWRYEAPEPEPSPTATSGATATPTSTTPATATGTGTAEPTVTATVTASPTSTEPPTPAPTATEDLPNVVELDAPDKANASYSGQHGAFAQAVALFTDVTAYPATIDMRTGVYFGINEFVTVNPYLENTIVATHTGVLRVTADVSWNGELWTYGLGDMHSQFFLVMSVSSPTETDDAQSDSFVIDSPTATRSVVGSTELTAFVEVVKGDEIHIQLNANCTSSGSANILASDTECDFYEGVHHIEWSSVKVEYFGD